MKPLIKWPGGKSGEICTIQPFIPPFERYVEPFFGGGALFFHLKPPLAAVNDISPDLINYYRLIKAQDPQLLALLRCYESSFRNMLRVCENSYGELLALYNSYASGALDEEALAQGLHAQLITLSADINNGFGQILLLDEAVFLQTVEKHLLAKLKRTVNNNAKRAFSQPDLKNNLLTGYAGGYYLYFRRVYNDWQLGRIEASPQYKAANFYFIREYCYGSMFRYNAAGEFNIPYGGMSYNKKDFGAKITSMFNAETAAAFAGTDIHCKDFAEFLYNTAPTERDFIFLDPPYDSDFSDYEGRAFTQNDQRRLAEYLQTTPAKFILVIKNTDFIFELYNTGQFQIIPFDNQYTYNVRCRNERQVEHLLVTNIPSE